MYNEEYVLTPGFSYMRAEEIFEKSVSVMKNLLTPAGVAGSVKRARSRSEGENLAILLRERENINELVRRVVDGGGSGDFMAGVTQDLKDALVMRYLRNRDLFMRTFPDGIEGVDTDSVCVWASIMISPMDEKGPG